MEYSFLVDFAEFDIDIALTHVLFGEVQGLLRPFLEVAFVGQTADALQHKNDVATLLVHPNLQPRTVEHVLNNTRQFLLVLEEAED